MNNSQRREWREWVGLPLLFVVAVALFLFLNREDTPTPPPVSQDSSGIWSDKQKIADFVKARQTFDWKDTAETRQDELRPYVTEKYLADVDLSFDESNADKAFKDQECVQNGNLIEVNPVASQASGAAIARVRLMVSCAKSSDFEPLPVDIVYTTHWINVGGEWRVNAEEFVIADEE